MANILLALPPSGQARNFGVAGKIIYMGLNGDAVHDRARVLKMVMEAVKHGSRDASCRHCDTERGGTSL